MPSSFSFREESTKEKTLSPHLLFKSLQRLLLSLLEVAKWKRRRIVVEKKVEKFKGRNLLVEKTKEEGEGGGKGRWKGEEGG